MQWSADPGLEAEQHDHPVAFGMTAAADEMQQLPELGFLDHLRLLALASHLRSAIRLGPCLGPPSRRHLVRFRVALEIRRASQGPVCPPSTANNTLQPQLAEALEGLRRAIENA